MHLVFKFIGWTICLGSLLVWGLTTITGATIGAGSEQGAAVGAVAGGAGGFIVGGLWVLGALLVGGIFLVIGKVLTPAPAYRPRRRRRV